jgi:hypothetical protein
MGAQGSRWSASGGQLAAWTSSLSLIPLRPKVPAPVNIAGMWPPTIAAAMPNPSVRLEDDVRLPDKPRDPGG